MPGQNPLPNIREGKATFAGRFDLQSHWTISSNPLDQSARRKHRGLANQTPSIITVPLSAMRDGKGDACDVGQVERGGEVGKE